MNSLNTDVMLHIGSFMSNATALAHVNRDLRENSNDLLTNQYKHNFGTVSEDIPRNIMTRILNFAENQPNVAVNHNYFKAPSSRLDRWKWIVGLENSLDKKVQKKYDENISLLKNTQATSILQLKNQLLGFWHSNRLIKDYKQFKAVETARATSGIINRLFFTCIKFIFKISCKPSRALILGAYIERWSKGTFAKIGSFDLNGKQYDVVAHQVLKDEDSICHFSGKRFLTKLSVWGKTSVGIVEKGQSYSSESFGHYGSNQNFDVIIARETANDKWLNISSEEHCGHGSEEVLNKRHLQMAVEYRGRTTAVNGSDRLLDQKLTQIMIEIAMQNKEIIDVKTESNHDDLTVLTAGGFHSVGYKSMIDELKRFRSVAENNLFPPYEDYAGATVKLETRHLTKPIVLFSRQAAEAWSDIVRISPILNPNAGVLPEFWLTKPNVIERVQ